MAKALVIVESPAKAKTINKYLGRDFVVKSSVGHIRDLPVKSIGIDTAKGLPGVGEIGRIRRAAEGDGPDRNG